MRGTGARRVQGGDLAFQNLVHRAHALGGGVQPRVQAVELAPDKAGQPRGIAGGGLIGGKQPVSGGQQGPGRLMHGGAARQRGGDGHEQHRWQEGAGNKQGGADGIERGQSPGTQPAPQEGGKHPHPEQAGEGRRRHGHGAEAGGADTDGGALGFRGGSARGR